MDNFSKLVQPPLGSWDRLQNKIRKEREQDLREMKWLAGVAAVLVCVFTLSLTDGNGSSRSDEAVAMEMNGKLSPVRSGMKMNKEFIEVKTSSPVRIYWVFD